MEAGISVVNPKRARGLHARCSDGGGLKENWGRGGGGESTGNPCGKVGVGACLFQKVPGGEKRVEG